MDLGNSAELRWSTTCADTITLNNGIGTVASSGSMAVTPAQLPLTYTVTAVNERSTATSSVTLRQIAPSATFIADPALIKVGEGATLSWTTTRATSCSISPEVGTVDCGGGSVAVHPAVPTTYKLTAAGPGGTVTRNATVGFVKPVADIEANPGTINEGESATLQWIFSNATTAVINQGIGEVQLGQTLEVSPAVTTTYAMTATGPGGTATDSVTITVIPANPPPVASISAAPLFIMKGESSVLSWSSANADTVIIDQGMGNVGASGSIPVSPEQTTTYTLTATGPGGTRTVDVKVTVLHPLPAITFTGIPETIMSGDTAVLNWSVIDAQSVSIDQGIGAVALEGTLEVSPASTTTYRLTATGPGGTAGKTVTVTVLHDPPTASLSVETDSVAKGSSTQLTWSSAHADACSITPDIGPVECNGTATVTPADTTTYSFIANGPGGSVIKTVTVTVMHPVPVITAYADPATIQPGESTILNWTSTDADLVTIDQGIGEQPANGQVTVTPAATTTYTITAAGPGGTASGTVTVTVAEPGPITLTITSPENGQTITRPEVMVTGTVNHASGLETGVVVNGIAAVIYNGTFIANHVPLIEGENTILVVATDAEGKTMQKSVTVTAPPIIDAVMVGCNYALGIAPLNATLVVASSFTLNSAPSFSYIGPGDVVFTQNGTPESRDISINAPGIYYFTAELSDEKGALYSADVAVVVLDRQQLDFQLKAKWNDLKAALVSGNIQDALALHHPSVRSEYETIYTALGDRFMALVGQMQDIELIFAENGRAQYRIRKEQIIDGKAEIITYYIYFYLDGGGIWRIENY